MTDEPAQPASPLEYKNRRIILTPDQQDDGTWVCHYSIIECGSTEPGSPKMCVDGSFPSREAAELAAVQKAKALIDLR